MCQSHWQIKTDADAVACYARDIIMNAAEEAIKARNIFKIVLAGGTTPKQVYHLLANAKGEWHKWQLYLGDERCLPSKDSERNSYMIQHTFLNKVDFPDSNIHFIPAELGASKAALAYSQVVHLALPFDLVVLGMGEDGHTASLFPKHQYSSNEWVHAVFNAAKPPTERVSLSTAALSQNNTLLRIITGASKAASIALWQQGQTLPISILSSMGDDIILLDEAAAGKISHN
jgi:6-phosphogluconolactonase